MHRRQKVRVLGCECGCGLSGVFPVWSKDSPGLVVASEPVDATFDEDEAVFAVNVVICLFEMFPHVGCFLDEEVELFGKSWGQTVCSEHALNLVAGN